MNENNELSFFLKYKNTDTTIKNISNEVWKLRQLFNAPSGGESLDMTTGLVCFRADRRYSLVEVKNKLESVYDNDRIAKQGQIFSIDLRVE